MFEGKCTNPECLANEVWILVDDDEDVYCPTCDSVFGLFDVAPTQKFADPNKVPDPAGLSKGS